MIRIIPIAIMQYMVDWRHSPLHRFQGSRAFMVTSGTYGKVPHFLTYERLCFLDQLLHGLAPRYDLELRAWAVLANHYHLIVLCQKEPSRLRRFIQHVHSRSARWVNELDSSPGRRVWFQYWDTALTEERGYAERLCYVHFNPIHHGLVVRARDYPWSSGYLMDQPSCANEGDSESNALSTRDDY